MSASKTQENLRQRVDVLGLAVDPVTISTTLARLAAWIDQGERHYVCVSPVHSVMESARDPALCHIHRAAGLVVPDGMPLVWLCQRAGFPDCRRVYGPDLLLAACRNSINRGWSHYFYGGGPGVARDLAASLQDRFPGLRVAGWESPPFRPPTPREDLETTERINDSGADLVWVGLGMPKQERWMSSRRPRLDPAVLIGVGAAFDFLAGRKPQAPAWMQKRGLEWLFRMTTEPRRLGPRYLRTSPEFVCRVLPRLFRSDWPRVEVS